MLTLRKGIRCQDGGSVGGVWGKVHGIVSHRPLSPCITGLLARAFFLLPKNKEGSFLLLLLTLLSKPRRHFVSQKCHTNSEYTKILPNSIRHRTYNNNHILVGPRGWPPSSTSLPLHTIQGPYQMPHWAVNVYLSGGDTIHNEGTGCREHYREHTTTSALHWNKLISRSVLLLITVHCYF